MDFAQFLLTKWWVILVVIAAIFALIKLVPRYKIAPPDTALIISGLMRRSYKVRTPDGSVTTKKFGYRIVRGGATFWIPAIERIDQLDMCLMQVDIRTAQPVPTKEYISVIVDAVAMDRSSDPILMFATASTMTEIYSLVGTGWAVRMSTWVRHRSSWSIRSTAGT